MAGRCANARAREDHVRTGARCEGDFGVFSRYPGRGMARKSEETGSPLVCIGFSH